MAEAGGRPSLLSRYGWVGALLGAMLVLGYLHSTATFDDPDAFYHGAIAESIVRYGAPSQLPQAWLTELAERYVDHHLLYHVLLWPFIALLGVAVGLKVGSVAFGAAAVATFHAVARRLGVRHVWPLTILLLTSPTWIYRLGLVKVTPLSLVVALAGVLLTVRRRPLALGALSFVYVYLYAGFAFLPAVATVLLLVDWYVERRQGPEGSAAPAASRTATWAATLVGSAVGVLATPHFPLNLSLYATQLISIGVINYGRVIGVGGEWYPVDVRWLLSTVGAPFVLTIFAIPLALVGPRRGAGARLGMAAVSFILMAFTFKSRRYAEYLVPFGLLTVGLAAQPWLAQFRWRAFWGWVREQPARWRGTVLTSAAVATACLALFGASAIVRTRNDLASGFPTTGYAPICSWLSEHLQPNTLVLNANWGEWPLLYACAPQLRFVVGLDPTFMYRRFPELAKRYDKFSRAELGADEVVPFIRDEIGSRYVVVSTFNQKLMDQLRSATGVASAFALGRVEVFQLTE